MPKIKYTIGDTHSNWTITGHAKANKHGQRQVAVQCSCGHQATHILSRVVGARSKYCRYCQSKMYINYEYKKAMAKYGKLTVIKQNKGPADKINIKVRCECGTVFFTRLTSLDSGNTTSCEFCGKNGHKAPRAAYKPRVSKPIVFTAMQSRSSGACRTPSICSNYRKCGDKMFECTCLGWVGKKDIIVVVEIKLDK